MEKNKTFSYTIIMSIIVLAIAIGSPIDVNVRIAGVSITTMIIFVTAMAWVYSYFSAFKNANQGWGLNASIKIDDDTFNYDVVFDHHKPMEDFEGFAHHIGLREPVWFTRAVDGSESEAREIRNIIVLANRPFVEWAKFKPGRIDYGDRVVPVGQVASGQFMLRGFAGTIAVIMASSDAGAILQREAGWEAEDMTNAPESAIALQKLGLKLKPGFDWKENTYSILEEQLIEAAGGIASVQTLNVDRFKMEPKMAETYARIKKEVERKFDDSDDETNQWNKETRDFFDPVNRIEERIELEATRLVDQVIKYTDPKRLGDMTYSKVLAFAKHFTPGIAESLHAESMVLLATKKIDALVGNLDKMTYPNVPSKEPMSLESAIVTLDGFFEAWNANTKSNDPSAKI